PESGISIFVFRNKLESGEIVTAHGMIEEFQLSVQNENIVVRIGFTKGASKVLLDKIQENFSVYFDDSLKRKFQELEKLDT
ncbi:SIR2 family protein, partial [Enterococcus faecalis]